ncbi:uncharacterized protein SOCEGT47_029330 [Sorangium cellulosum]|uniref:Uncharacterized protein n=1 Tax=Sorangium cellulosum TaxID=56 RepID=A0A4P2PZY4_SORCE|nr:hypothetical protein [Sorangium cellulosum]AUX22430.1 uncharacterized protein SOCEGT47_029330 [Sorangium cellulosum]
MKTSRQCPKCQSRKLWVVHKVEQPRPEGWGTNPLHVTSQYVLTGNTDVVSAATALVNAGFFEAWICAVCGFTEWYARDANNALAQLAAHPSPRVQYIDGETSGTPYR